MIFPKNDPLINFDPSKDFFELNPQLKFAFSQFTSNEMWAIALYASPTSIYKNMLNKEKKKLISEEFLNEPFDWDLHKDSINKFSNLHRTKAEKLLSQWEKDLEERQEFLASIEYKPTTPEDLLNLKEKWNKDTHNMWKYFMICKKDVDTEEQVEGLAGSQKSAQEENKI